MPVYYDTAYERDRQQRAREQQALAEQIAATEEQYRRYRKGQPPHVYCGLCKESLVTVRDVETGYHTTECGGYSCLERTKENAN